MSDTVNINLVKDDEINVYYEEKAHIDNNACILFIKSGQKEIQDYVDNVSIPQLEDFVETEAKPIVSEVVSDMASAVINYYLENTTKPEINKYVDEEIKPELQTFVDRAENAADRAESAVVNAAKPFVSFEATVNSSDWSENSYTISYTDIKADDLVFVSPVSTQENIDKWSLNGVYASDQVEGVGIVLKCKTIPNVINVSVGVFPK